VLAQVYDIAERHELLVLNVFHAGDGNLHPLLVYDAREPGSSSGCTPPATRSCEVSLAAGGVLSGEHGIGLEKRDLMPLMFSDVDLEAQAALRRAFDPHLLSNPDKVLPRPAGCGDLHSVAGAMDGAWV
jgi:glycolate oxidase